MMSDYDLCSHSFLAMKLSGYPWAGYSFSLTLPHIIKKKHIRASYLINVTVYNLRTAFTTLYFQTMPTGMLAGQNSTGIAYQLYMEVQWKISLCFGLLFIFRARE